jgi:subtilase family serine protease
MRRYDVTRRIFRALAALSFLLAATVSTVVFSGAAAAASRPASISLSGSYSAPPPGAHFKGSHAANQDLTISLVLQPRNSAALDSFMAALYDANSAQYHKWLGQGQFNALFAPSTAQTATATKFLERAGLKVIASPSPFMVRATGSTAQVQAAFKTHINDYVAANGRAFFQNDTDVQLPASMSGVVSAVTGLTNTAKAHANYITTAQAAQSANKVAPKYGAGPGGSGLAPSQTAGIYGADQVYKLGASGQGKGTTLAVFELSGYTPGDVAVYEHQFFGSKENVPLVDINVDGGPVTPVCPKGDTCNPPGDYSGDIEVVADIETQIAIAPKVDRVLVYNAPNDLLGTTAIDEYYKIANDDLADSVSSSWGLCEPDATLANAKAEFYAFAQMAAQGQSMFSSAGDTGAYDCLRDTGSSFLNNVTVDDPTSQPFVTSVGGTSFGTFDPGSNKHPSYPTGFETVWNPLDLCSGTTKGLTNCVSYGAGGGGISSFWGQPRYQSGPGVINAFSKKSPYCSQAAAGQYCREVPDVSANADEYTPYAEYCTGSASTNSTCATFSSKQVPPGWFGIGGTSLSSPLWSGIVGLWDSVHRDRIGNTNAALYSLFRSDNSYSLFFHDITGQNQTENNNGLYPVTPTYDLATGIGTPRISGFAKSNP